MSRGPLRMLRGAVARRRDGTFALRLDPDEVAFLVQLAGQVDGRLDDPGGDPGVIRLFPPAHPDDVMAEAAWQIEQGAQLRASHRAALGALAHPPDRPLTEEELVRWMNGVNILRLVLADRLGVTREESDEDDLLDAARARAGDDDPEVAGPAQAHLQAWSAYTLLGWMVDGAVQALSSNR